MDLAVPGVPTWNLYEYVVEPDRPDIIRYMYLISTTPPPVPHKVIIENLDSTHVSTGVIRYEYLCAVVRIEHVTSYNSCGPLPDEFEILSPIFVNDRHAKDFAKKEFGREWRNTYGVMWFLGRPR
jgi:hypothetical protein